MQPQKRIIVALDRSEPDDILRLADILAGQVGMFKLGLQAFIANGPSIVRAVRDRGLEVFLDLKLHDIPNTVRHAVSEAVKLDIALLTVHATGGAPMLEAAVEARSDARLLAVTILTSLGRADLDAIGWNASEGEVVTRLARLVQTSGVDGVVASPMEIAGIREACGSELLIVTPGIRESGAPADDQKRTMSAAEAVAAGADYLVIGRPITGAADPSAAARRLADSIG